VPDVLDLFQLDGKEIIAGCEGRLSQAGAGSLPVALELVMMMTGL
jgi:hypothetical protein